MIELENLEDLRAYIDKPIGVSEWLQVDQPMIDAFAELTGDHQWIHTDVERASRDMPGGTTIAHGWLLLSLLPRLSKDFYTVRNVARSVNYGSNKIRFVSAVPSGSKVRLTQSLAGFEPVEAGARLTFASVIEIDGASRPGVIAETLRVSYSRR